MLYDKRTGTTKAGAVNLEGSPEMLGCEDDAELRESIRYALASHLQELLTQEEKMEITAVMCCAAELRRPCNQ